MNNKLPIEVNYGISYFNDDTINRPILPKTILGTSREFTKKLKWVKSIEKTFENFIIHYRIPKSTGGYEEGNRKFSYSSQIYKEIWNNNNTDNKIT